MRYHHYGRICFKSAILSRKAKNEEPRGFYPIQRIDGDYSGVSTVLFALLYPFSKSTFFSKSIYTV